MIGVFSALDGYFVLRILGSNADTNVLNHWYLGWSKPCVCHDKVLLIYIARLVIDVGGIHLFIHEYQ